MSDRELYFLSLKLGEQLCMSNCKLASAESCTGGWIAKVLTDIAGSSTWFSQGFVTYSALAKQQQLGVLAATIEGHGIVSAAVVKEMARGARHVAGVDYAISVTGVAGPTGGSEPIPVGTVWFGFARKNGQSSAIKQQFHGNRDAVRRQAVAFALAWLIQVVAEN